jgi:hypothetical protein
MLSTTSFELPCDSSRFMRSTFEAPPNILRIDKLAVRFGGCDLDPPLAPTGRGPVSELMKLSRSRTFSQ